MDFIFKIKKFILGRVLIEPGDHVLAAVSGGIDSIAMTEVLLRLKDELGFMISVAHINHGLRGKDSDEDERFVKDYCAKRELPFYSIKWSGPKEGENVQEAARNFRYDSFVELAAKIGVEKVALAHNQDDQAETVLLNLIRGAGLDGICGMSVKKNLSERLMLIRPLITVTRKEIEELVREKDISFRNDATNDQTKYTRNFIRHKIIPLVREINPLASHSIAHMTELLQMDEDFIQGIATALFDSTMISEDSKHITFSEEVFKRHDQPVRTRMLKHAYVKLTGSVAGIARDHILKMDHIATGEKKEGTYTLPNRISFERKGGRLAIFKS